MTKDGEVALVLQPVTVSNRCLPGAVIYHQVADAVVEAELYAIA